MSDCKPHGRSPSHVLLDEIHHQSTLTTNQEAIHYAGLHAIRYRDNWDGEGDICHLIAVLHKDGTWTEEESGKKLLEYDGDEILQAWPLYISPASQTAGEIAAWSYRLAREGVNGDKFGPYLSLVKPSQDDETLDLIDVRPLVYGDTAPSAQPASEAVADEVEREWNETWRDIVAPNGTIDISQLKKELADYSMLLDAVAKVYMHVTGGKISNPNTLPEVVCSVADDHTTELLQEQHGDTVQPTGKAAAVEFFAYDSECGFETFNTEAEAKKYAQDSIDSYREEAAEGWPEEVESVRWGVVLGTTKQVPVPDDGYDGSQGVADSGPFVDYVLTEYTTQLAQVPDGWQLVPTEPTPKIMAAAAIAAWPQASAGDVAMAKKAALIVMQSMKAMPGVTVDMLAATLATMAPAYRAMLNAATKPKGGE